jgi:hypothetical protein
MGELATGVRQSTGYFTGNRLTRGLRQWLLPKGSGRVYASPRASARAEPRDRAARLAPVYRFV